MSTPPTAPSAPGTEQWLASLHESYDQTTGRDGAVAAAWADREARLAADAATMAAGPTEHMANMTAHHQGAPSVQVQMVTHGAPAPRTPDVSPPGSASDPIG